MPIDRTNRDAELRGQIGLGDIRVALNIFEQGKIVGRFERRFHSLKFSD